MSSPEPTSNPPSGPIYGPGNGDFFSELRLAACFLTILPLGPRTSADDEAIAASFRWFPLVGFALGLVLALEDYALGFLFLDRTVRATLLVLSLTVITGAVHLDGLADTADALGAGGNRERALEILRDSRIGSFGAIAIFFALALKVAALAAMPATTRYQAIIAAVGIARWSMVAVSSRSDYLRASGAGTSVLGFKEQFNTIGIATLTTGAALISIHTLAVGAAFSTAIFMWPLLTLFYKRWLGGVTGDLIGACGELVEVAVLLVMSI